MQNVFVLITNNVGSTISPPVTVQASVMSDLGGLLPQRLKQLAETIEDSPADNLGLNNSTFGRVKSIRLSSYLKHSLQTTPPTPSPSPSPGKTDSAVPSDPPIPVHYPAPSPNSHHSPCSNCDASSPSDYSYPPAPSPKSEAHNHSPPTEISPAPSAAKPYHSRPCPDNDPSISPSSSPAPQYSSMAPASSPHSASSGSPPVGLTPHFSPGLSPIPLVSYSSSPRKVKADSKDLPTPSSPAPVVSCKLLSSFSHTRLLYIFSSDYVSKCNA